MKTVLEAIKEINAKGVDAETGDIIEITGLSYDEVVQAVSSLHTAKKVVVLDPHPDNDLSAGIIMGFSRIRAL